MLKVYGNLYGNSKEDIKTMAKTLEKDGFQIAYQNETSAVVIKEIPDIEEDADEQ